MKKNTNMYFQTFMRKARILHAERHFPPKLWSHKSLEQFNCVAENVAAGAKFRLVENSLHNGIGAFVTKLRLYKKRWTQCEKSVN